VAIFLGIDVGTSATKVVACDEQGRVLAQASASYPLSHPRPGWSEQDPELWWGGVASAIRALGGEVSLAEVRAVGLSGQMHGSVLLPKDAHTSGGRAGALRPALLWNDQRTGDQCREIERAAGGRRALVRRVGNAALTGFTLPKLLWVREHESEVMSRTGTVLMPKDFVRFRLTGELATDVGDASGTLLFDVAERRWSPEMFASVGLAEGLVPPALESAAAAGRVTPWAAQETGLAAGTLVVAGSGDNMAGAVGAGVVSTGLVLATLGTSGVVYAHTDKLRLDVHFGEQSGRIHTMCAATGSEGHAGGWCVTGCMLSAGGAIKWCRDVLAPGTSFDALLREAESAPPGSEGLVFLPYLTGERCPHPDPTARGGWIGLTARHGRAHMVRAVVEGVTFGMTQILDLMRGIGITTDRVRLGGGGSRSLFGRQLQADMYGCTCEVTSTDEGPALGAALLAGVGAGHWASVVEASEVATLVRETLEPNRRTKEQLGPVFEVYKLLYADLKGRFAALSESAAVAGAQSGENTRGTD